jgi:hypothetical protein
MMMHVGQDFYDFMKVPLGLIKKMVEVFHFICNFVAFKKSPNEKIFENLRRHVGHSYFVFRLVFRRDDAG